MDFNSMYGNTNNYDMMMLMNQTNKESHQNKEVKDQKGLVGVVTKFQSGIGYIDDLIFFDTTALMGCYPKIGDKVLVDASYDEQVPLKWKAYRIQSLPILKQNDNKKLSGSNHSYRSYMKNEEKTNHRHENVNHHNRKHQGAGFIDYDAPPSDPSPDVGSMFNFMMQGGNAQPNLSLPNNNNLLLNNDLSAATAALMMAAAGGGLGSLLQQNPGPDQGAAGLVNSAFNRPLDFGGGHKRSRYGALDKPGSGGGAGAYSRSRDRSVTSRSTSRRCRYKRDRPDPRRSPPNKSKGADGRHCANANDDHKRPPPHNNGGKRWGSPSQPSHKREGKRMSAERSRAPPKNGLVMMKCNIPRVNLSRRIAGVYELWNRFPNLYIPSEFVTVKYRWMDDLPIDKPLSLNVYSPFEIYDKKEYDEKDVDYSYNNPSTPRQVNVLSEDGINQDIITVKVMLLNCPGLQALYNKSFGYDGVVIDELPRNFRHLSRLLKFLLANKGKKENMALGGQWSAKLDGPDPINNPSTLINTAIRTTKYMTGIDLSACVNWYRILEIYYRRCGEECDGEADGEEDAMKKVNHPNINPTNEDCKVRIGGRMEKVYVLMPDVWSLITPISLAAGTAAEQKVENDCNNGFEHVTGSVKEEPCPSGVIKTEMGCASRQDLNIKREMVSDGALASTRGEAFTDIPTSPHTNVVQIKTELFVETDDALMNEGKEAIDTELNNKAFEASIAKKAVRAPSKPCISVFPSKNAYNGKFECSLVPLSTMLDYSEKDTREYVFEVSLFAEAFNDMLQRDFGYYIYRALCNNGTKRLDTPSDSPNTHDKSGSGVKQEEILQEDKSHSSISANAKKNDMKTAEDNEIAPTKNDDKKADHRECSKNRKPYIKDPFLLMSFTYFDTTFNGHLLEKDVEAILFSLDLALTRAQVKKLYGHQISKDTLNYRALTDGHYNEKVPLPVISSSFVHKELTFGNKSDVERLSDGGTAVGSVEHSDRAVSVNSYGHVDVPNLLKRLRTLEEASLIADNKFVELNKESAALKLSLDKETNRAKRCGDEIKKLGDKLHSNHKETEALKKEMEDAKRGVKYALENLKNSSRKLETIIYPPSKNDIDEPEKNKSVS